MVPLKPTTQPQSAEPDFEPSVSPSDNETDNQTMSQNVVYVLSVCLENSLQDAASLLGEGRAPVPGQLCGAAAATPGSG